MLETYQDIMTPMFLRIGGDESQLFVEDVAKLQCKQKQQTLLQRIGEIVFELPTIRTAAPPTLTIEPTSATAL